MKFLSLNSLKLAFFVFVFLAGINIAGFFITKYFGLGWAKDLTWYERAYVPLIYSLLLYLLLLYTDKAIFLLPLIYLSTSLLLVLINNIYGIELITYTNFLLSYLFDFGDYILQKKGIKSGFIEYSFHIVGMFIYQFGILKIFTFFFKV
ncbi:MAG: hypothetical protein KJZ56_12675 [Flavobacteriales bacterium]|nr:hypothetical protein [Flavobacteriales bacterium]